MGRRRAAARPGPARAAATRFAAVGAVCLALDIALFNAVLAVGGEPVAAKAAAVAAAAVVGFWLSRRWGYASLGGHDLALRAQVAGFALVNALALGAAVGCVGFARYVLGAAGALALNVAANVVGTAMGGAIRWFGYPRVFRAAARS